MPKYSETAKLPEHTQDLCTQNSMPIIPALSRQEQEDSEFEVSYIVILKPGWLHELLF